MYDCPCATLKELKNHIVAARFPGLSGNVAFDENSDRLAPYEVRNIGDMYPQREVEELLGKISKVFEMCSRSPNFEFSQCMLVKGCFGKAFLK